MSTNAAILESSDRNAGPAARSAVAGAAGRTRYLVPLGRLFFAAIFMSAIIGHVSPQTAEFAAQTGVPMATLLVPLSGVLALAGGLSIALGYRARLGALLVVAFLVPVTLTMHPFWAETDPMAMQMQQGMFFKNVSMLGGALLIAHFGAGPISIDARSRARRDG